MIATKCSYCNGRGILAHHKEAIEEYLYYLLELKDEPEYIITCPRCRGTGVEIEVELADLCQVNIV